MPVEFDRLQQPVYVEAADAFTPSVYDGLALFSGGTGRTQTTFLMYPLEHDAEAEVAGNERPKLKQNSCGRNSRFRLDM